jgi:hypothetical protein
MTTECVGRRVDWITVAFRVRLDADVLAAFVTTPKEKPPQDATFRARAALAQKYRIASCTLPLGGGGERREFAMRMMGESKILLQNRDCRLVILENAPKSPGPTWSAGAKGATEEDLDDPGWTVAVDFSGTTLLAMGWRKATREACALARALGEVLEARLRRLDLCADMADFPLPAPADHGWCNRPQLRSREMHRSKREHIPKRVRAAEATHGRKLLRSYEKGDITWQKMMGEFPDIDETYYYPAANITGWKFGKGTIRARVYDKHAEMRKRIGEATTADKKRQAGEKKAAEERWWLANGWNGKGRVVRVEVETHTDVLNELDARCDTPAGPVDCDKLVIEIGEQLDRVWRYFAGLPSGRRPLPPLADDGKCSKCKVKHKAPEECPYTEPLRSGWLRQIILETDRKGRPKRRSACEPTDAWKVVQAVTFEREVTMVPKRERKHGAVRATQALGVANALLAFVEQLRHPIDPQTGEVIEQREDKYAQALAQASPGHMPRRDAEPGAPPCLCGTCMAVRKQVARIFNQTGAEVADTLLWVHDEQPHEALALVWTRMNAAIARWKAHLPDEPMPDDPDTPMGQLIPFPTTPPP